MGGDAGSEVRQVFAAYAAGFDAADAPAITKLFVYPAMIWQFGTGHVFADEAELAENVEALIDVFDEAGIKRLIPDMRSVQAAGNSAFADVLWRQEDEAGEVLHRFACRYLLVRDAVGWRIATVVRWRHLGGAKRRLRTQGPRARMFSGSSGLAAPPRCQVPDPPLRQTDGPACARIYDRAWHQGHPYAPMRIDLAAFEASTRGERVLVAEDEGKIVGFVSLYEPESFVHHLFVHPDAQGRGIGRALLEEAVRLAGGRASLKCQTRNGRSIEFYRRLGWTEGECGESDVGQWLRFWSPS